MRKIFALAAALATLPALAQAQAVMTWAGQNLSISQANDQWQAGAPVYQTGQPVTARWARAAMIALQDAIPGEGR